MTALSFENADDGAFLFQKGPLVAHREDRTAWPELPAAMKAGILAMVKAASAGTKLGPQDRASEAQIVRS